MDKTQQKHTKYDLKQMQALPLCAKVHMTMARIRAWYDYWGGQVYLAFSGGKDSAVLLDIIRKTPGVYDVPAVFIDTGLEYPEVRLFAISQADVILRPKMRFDQVLKEYGYPVISKEISQKVQEARSKPNGYAAQSFNADSERSKKYGGRFSLVRYSSLLATDFKISDRCCHVMKKRPAEKYERETGRKPILAMLASESRKRQQGWLKTGCNAFNTKRPQSNPMAFWTEQDVLRYIKENSLPIASVYGDIVPASEQMNPDGFGGEMQELKTTGCDRTGCIFCAFGCHRPGGKNFERLKETHPRQWRYCIGGGEYNEEGVWQPNKQGLGMGHVFEELNKIYSDDFIKYGKEREGTP